MEGAHLPYNLKPDVAVFAKEMGNGYHMAAIIGKSDEMEVAQDKFISSKYWTDRVGPTATLATINKIKEKNVNEHLIRAGKKMKDLWRTIAPKHDMDIEISGIDSRGHFDFKYEKTFIVKTLFTQVMLEKGFMASNRFYASYVHKNEYMEK